MQDGRRTQQRQPGGRPRNEARTALARAVSELADLAQQRGPIMREIAQHSGVGLKTAETYLENMARTGEIRCIRDRRKVPYRSRPVAEYLPVVAEAPPPGDAPPPPDFAALTLAWHATSSGE